jgi:hypothetical protein
MACAALRARSMIFSSAERVMFIANSLCAHRPRVKVGGQQKSRHANSSFTRACTRLAKASSPRWNLLAQAHLPQRTPRPAHYASRHRVEFHITAHLSADRHPGHQNGRETALEHMPHLAMAAVECLRDQFERCMCSGSDRDCGSGNWPARAY